MTPVIGLFGTCGTSSWRDEFIKSYTAKNISFFNPQVPDGTWTPGCIKEENDHLMNDDIILFPVTSETTGQGSLAEIGFSISAALRRNPDRYFIFMIDDVCKDPQASESAINDSIRSRKLVKSKLQEIVNSNSGVYLVESLDKMLELSLQLYNIVYDFARIKNEYGS